MIEIEETSRIKPELERLEGIDSGRYVWLRVGWAWAVPGYFEAGHSVRAALPENSGR